MILKFIVFFYGIVSNISAKKKNNYYIEMLSKSIFIKYVEINILNNFFRCKRCLVLIFEI